MLNLPPSLAELRAAYRASAEASAQAQIEELAALSNEEALRRILSIALFTSELPPSRSNSGLVEQQALFRRFQSR